MFKYDLAEGAGSVMQAADPNDFEIGQYCSGLGLREPTPCRTIRRSAPDPGGRVNEWAGFAGLSVLTGNAAWPGAPRPTAWPGTRFGLNRNA